MIVIGTRPRGWINVLKNPADAMAPYRADLRLPDGRRYQGRMRSHPARSGQAGFWYEGFVTANHADTYAHDQQLARYPAMPAIAPVKWNLLPCQIKLNPYSAAGDADALIGSVWVSRIDGAEGGEVFTILAGLRHGSGTVIAGDVLHYRQSPRASEAKQLPIPSLSAPQELWRYA